MGVTEERRFDPSNTVALHSWRGSLLAIGMVLAVLTLWELVVWLTDTPVYLLPAPTRIIRTFLAQPGYFFEALMVTLGEAVAG
ncbi:MAG: hypothetical protein RMJ60_05705, partial [Anaerolineales bacterium]|nr:hypothetical protein [Anaerolineales bacterium]